MILQQNNRPLRKWLREGERSSISSGYFIEKDAEETEKQQAYEEDVPWEDCELDEA